MWLWANDIINAWEGVPNGTLSMMFTCCPNLIFLASKWLETEISNWSFCYFEKFKADIHLANFEQVKTVTICFFLLTVDKSQSLYSVYIRRAAENNPNPLHLIKIQEPHIGSGASYFQWFNYWKSRTGFLCQ